MRTAVCAIAKNEHRHLEEWITYHLGIGFDEIWIGEDYDSRTHRPITDKYDEERVHLVRLSDNMPGVTTTTGRSSRQARWYAKFFKENKDRLDWIANLDVDEYVEIETGTLHQFLSDYEDYGGVCLAWKYYGANGHITIPEGRLQDNYTKVDYGTHHDCQVKTIVNCKKSKEVLYIHAANGECVNIYKELDFKHSLNGIGYSHPRYWHKAWIRHYFTRSWEDWMERMKRGNFNNNYRNLDTFFEYNQDMAHLQEELICKAMEDVDDLRLNQIYSKKYSLYNEVYARKLKMKFLNTYGRKHLPSPIEKRQLTKAI